MNFPMTNYVLIEHFIEDSYVLGVYSSRANAEKERARLEASNPSRHRDWQIQEFQLDAPGELVL